jgi:hypothetical protein
MLDFLTFGVIWLTGYIKKDILRSIVRMTFANLGLFFYWFYYSAWVTFFRNYFYIKTEIVYISILFIEISFFLFLLSFIINFKRLKKYEIIFIILFLSANIPLITGQYKYKMIRDFNQSYYEIDLTKLPKEIQNDSIDLYKGHLKLHTYLTSLKSIKLSDSIIIKESFFSNKFTFKDDILKRMYLIREFTSATMNGPKPTSNDPIHLILKIDDYMICISNFIQADEIKNVSGFKIYCLDKSILLKGIEQFENKLNSKLEPIDKNYLLLRLSIYESISSFLGGNYRFTNPISNTARLIELVNLLFKYFLIYLILKLEFKQRMSIEQSPSQ